MDPPETRYAKSGNLSIAYQVVGGGPLDLVYVPGFVSNLDTVWENPGWAHFFMRLSSFSRLILFDKRGTGVSDRVAGIASLEERMDDVRAVMDAVGCQRAALFGVSEGGPMSLLFAATYPERASALVIYASYARHPTLTPESLEGHLKIIERAWGTGEYFTRFFFPAKAADETFRRNLARLERQGASPSAVATILKMNAEIDARHILPAIRTPTMILHRVGDTRVTVDAGRYLAAHIPGAKFIELPGDNHIPVMERDILDLIADETEEFLTGYRANAELDRVLATVMFTDIVDSTKRAAALGDRMWRATLDRHDEIVRQQLMRFRGREVKHTGDGFLATFDGPARAVRCAAAIADTMHPLGITVRGGLHTGEIELKGDDIGGIAVNIAARVAAMAGPSETLVSSTVRDLVAGSGLRFEDRGRHALKGLPEEVQLYMAL
ncbi:MAG: adenylate/guanylate cyclase domain-containing protein [Alphaproteobacteria bacterium]|nr:adenylate/guanylate cyclase domain-containing protein [Alphaproteobacteria bacterium]